MSREHPPFGTRARRRSCGCYVERGRVGSLRCLAGCCAVLHRPHLPALRGVPGATRLPPGSPPAVLTASPAVVISPRTGIPHTRRYCPIRLNEGRLLNLLSESHYTAIRLRIGRHLSWAGTLSRGKGVCNVGQATAPPRLKRARNYFVTTGHFACITDRLVLRCLPGIASSCPRAPGGLAAWEMRTTGRRWYDGCQARPGLGRQIRNGGSRRSCQRSFDSGYRPSLVQRTRKRHVSRTPTKSMQCSRTSLGAASLRRVCRAGATGRNLPTGCCSPWCQTCGTGTRSACRTRIPSSIRLPYRG